MQICIHQCIPQRMCSERQVQLLVWVTDRLQVFPPNESNFKKLKPPKSKSFSQVTNNKNIRKTPKIIKI